jgi:LmbE family N-acetylglucosaminyl deacetylase
VESRRKLLDSGRRYLFLFAHPDDEALIAGTMRMLLTQGAHVHAAWITSGDYFGGRDLRERELSKAMNILGLGEERVRLLRLPSLRLLRQLPRYSRLVSDLMEEVRPDTVFVTAYEGGHPDHDAVNFMASYALKRLSFKATLFEFPLYNGSGPFYYWWWRINSFPPGEPTVLYNPLDNDAIQCKYRMMAAYLSQWIFMIAARLACSRSRMQDLGEPFRRCPEGRDHAFPPYPGRLNYERWFNVFLQTRFRHFREAVLNARGFQGARDGAG